MKGNLHIEIKASVPKTETKYSCLFRIPFTNIHIGQGEQVYIFSISKEFWVGGEVVFAKMIFKI